MSLAEGWRALEADDLPAAETHARRALERDPADPEAYLASLAIKRSG